MKKRSDAGKTLLYFMVFAVVFSACETEDPVPRGKGTPGSQGVFILNEGNPGSNDASLSYCNFETGQLTADVLAGELGSLAQSMIAYGGKLYIVVCESSNLTVLDVETHELVKRISVTDENNQPRKPRYLAAYGRHVYASTIDGHVVRLDTASLALDGVAKVGKNPEGIAALNGKLYVANSGGWDYPAPPDSTLSVVDIARFEEEKKIRVGVNPYIVKADKRGNIYLTYQGDFFSNLPGGIQKLNTATGEVTTLDIPANQKFDLAGDLLYFYSLVYDENFNPVCTFGVYDTVKGERTSDPVISDGTPMKSPNGIGVHPQTREVYIADSDFPNKSRVYVFGTDGKKVRDFEAGIGANLFVFHP